MRTFQPMWPNLQFRRLICLLLIVQMLTGCQPRTHLLYYLKRPGHDMAADAENYYKAVATQISYPDVNDVAPESVAFSRKPRTLKDRLDDGDEIWDMTLSEAIQLALSNNKIVRRNDRSTLQSNTSQILTNPDALPSIYDPAIQESGVLFGNRGVESALSAFDTQLAASLLLGKNDTIQNNAFTSGGLPPGSVLQSNTGQYQSSLTKNLGTGGTIALTNNWNYIENNLSTNLFPGVYTGNVGANFSQPLLAGSGTDFVRTAGPLGANIQGVSGVNQGISIARINEDISLADFELQVQNMLWDTEKLYWDLYYAYRQYDSADVNLKSSLRTWREVKAKADIGAKGGGAADESFSKETYFQRRAAMEAALANIDFLEGSMRRMCGLAVNDGRIIRPVDEPINAEYVPDWFSCLAEALTRRVEIRRAKWNIKSLDLQLAAAKNLTMPQLNFVTSYQINGFGQDLASFRQEDFKTNGANLHSAISNLITGQNTGYTAGFNFAMPIGFRAALAQVRNIELRLAKYHAVLAAQEQDISLELAGAFQDLYANFKTAQSNFNRRHAAELEVQAYAAEYEAGTRTLDFLLQAQARQASAENDYYNSIVTYTKAIAEINYRKGTLLDMDNVHLSEGQWSPEAYQDALRRAWARAAAFDTNMKHTEPPEFSNPGMVGKAELVGAPSEVPQEAPPLEAPDGESGPPPMEAPTEEMESAESLPSAETGDAESAMLSEDPAA